MSRILKLKELFALADGKNWSEFENKVAKYLFNLPYTADTSHLTNQLYIDSRQAVNDKYLELTKHRCVVIEPESGIVILDNLDMYEFRQIINGMSNGIFKLPAKATINFDEYYGDDGKANWSNSTFPVVVDKSGNLIWDY